MKCAAPDSALWHLANEVQSWKLHSASARASYEMHEYRRRDCGCAKKEERSEKIHFTNYGLWLLDLGLSEARIGEITASLIAGIVKHEPSEKIKDRKPKTKDQILNS
jgi:hypothetical protein